MTVNCLGGYRPQTDVFRHRVLVVVMAAVSVVALSSVARSEDGPVKVTYQDHVRPILQEHCFACHSQDDRSSDLALDTYNDVMVGGAGGEIFAGGDAGGSRLWQLITHQDAPEMPPDSDKLPQAQLDVIKAWIDGGLLKDAGSKPKLNKLAGAGGFVPAADNRPAGEPAMPEGIFRQPIVYAERPGAVGAVAVSPWAPLAAVAGLRQVSLYHTDNGALLGIVPYAEGMPQSIRFSRDGSLLLVAGGWPARLGNAAIYDVKTGARVAAVGEETDVVLAADISPDQSLVALGGPKKVVRVFRVADGSLAYEIRKHTEWVTAIEFSPDGKLLATADRGGGLYLWDGPTGNERAELRGHSEHITAVSWRADSQALASASEDDTVRLWAPGGNQIKSWGAHSGGVLSVHFAGDGALVSAGRDRVVKTWAVDGKHTKDVVQLADIALAARLTHDSKQVLATDWSGRVQLFDAATGEPRAELPANPPTLEMRMAAATTRLEQTATDAAEKDQRLQSVSAQLAEAERTVGDFQQQRTAAVQSAERQNAARLAAAAQAVREMEQWRKAIEAAAATATELNGQRQQLADARNHLAASLAAAQSSSEGDTESAEAQVNQQRQVVAEIESAVQTLQQRADVIESEVQQAQAKREAAQQAADQASLQFREAQSQLAEIDATGAQLPNVASLQREFIAAEEAANSATALHDAAQQQHAALAAELEAFHTAEASLHAALQQRAAAIASHQAKTEAAKQDLADAQAVVAEHKATADAVAAELEQLRERLKALREEERAAKSSQLDREQELAELAAALTDAERQAALAEAKLQQHQAAQKLRAEYAAKRRDAQADDQAQK